MFDKNEVQQRIDRTRSQWGKNFSGMRDAHGLWISAWSAIENKQAWINEEEQRLQGVEKEIQNMRRELTYRASIQIPQKGKETSPTAD